MTVENETQTYYKYSNSISINNSQQTMNMHIENADLPVFLLSDAERNGRTTPEDHAAACLARPLSAELLRESLNGILRDALPGLQKACV